MINKLSLTTFAHAFLIEQRMRIGPVLTAIFAVVAGGCVGYMPGQKAHWDAEIRALCEREGHVRIIAPVTLSKQQVRAMPRTEGQIALRMQINQPVEDPVYARIEKTTHLRRQDPEVVRTDVVAIRNADQQIVARWVEYSRVGGDPLTGLAHQSSFQCPDARQVLRELQPMFVIEN
jgi:hypothetical protein